MYFVVMSIINLRHQRFYLILPLYFALAAINIYIAIKNLRFIKEKRLREIERALDGLPKLSTNTSTSTSITLPNGTILTVCGIRVGLK